MIIYADVLVMLVNGICSLVLVSLLEIHNHGV